jgi:hypothetical protein
VFMDEKQIRARIQALIAGGEVPCETPDAVYGGYGDGLRCSLCDERIPSNEIEFEIDLPTGTRLRVHRRCEAIWLEECQTPAA